MIAPFIEHERYLLVPLQSGLTETELSEVHATLLRRVKERHPRGVLIDVALLDLAEATQFAHAIHAPFPGKLSRTTARPRSTGRSTWTMQRSAHSSATWARSATSFSSSPYPRYTL